MEPVIMRRQSIIMFPLTEHERHVKRQVECLQSGQMVEEYGDQSDHHIPALIELVEKHIWGFARAKISGMTWILCRQYDQNPWQAIGFIAKRGIWSLCPEPVKEEKPEVKESKSPLSAKARREIARARARQIMGKSPTMQTMQTMAAMAALVQPPRR